MKDFSAFMSEAHALYHSSYTDAINTALKHHKGLDVSSEDRDTHIAMGPRKPAEGETVKHDIPATDKDGNAHMIHIQVYNKGGNKPFELNTYFSKISKKKMSEETEMRHPKSPTGMGHSSDAHFNQQSQKMQDAIIMHLRSGKNYPEAVKAAGGHVNEADSSDSLGDHKGLQDYANSLGPKHIDRHDLLTAASHMAFGNKDHLTKHLKTLDTDVRDKVKEYMKEEVDQVDEALGTIKNMKAASKFGSSNVSSMIRGEKARKAGMAKVSTTKDIGYKVVDVGPGQKETVRKMHNFKEESDQIDEISKTTLASYSQKTSELIKGNQPADPDKLRKRTNRERGFNLAYRKYYGYKTKVPAANEEVEIDEAVSVKKKDYSWGKMITVHHGSSHSFPLHPEHQEKIAKLKDGESVSFKDETKAKVKAHREGDTIHLSHEGSNTKTPVSYAHFSEEYVDEAINSMSDAKLNFFLKVPHGKYTKKEISAEHERRKKTRGPEYNQPTSNKAKAVEETFEPIAEISAALAMRASRAATKEVGMGKSDREDKLIGLQKTADEKYRKMQGHSSSAKVATTSEETVLDEVSKKTIGTYLNKLNILDRPRLKARGTKPTLAVNKVFGKDVKVPATDE